MTRDPFSIKRIATKFEAAWTVAPQLRFGQLVDAIELLAWDRYYAAYPNRHFAMRLSELDDATFEAGLNDWIAGKRSDPGRQQP